MDPIITNQELVKLVEANAVLLVEAASGLQSQNQFNSGHLLNAQFVDLECDLSRICDPQHGGRHPLPRIEDFSILLGRLGILRSTHIVVYDRANGTNSAARFWWMLRSLGHSRVQVLSGGFHQAKAFGLPTSSNYMPVSEVEPYSVDDWNLPTKDINQVYQTSKDMASLIIDVREEKRFRGDFEPIDTVAGHIPNAINIPLSNNLTEDGFFKSPEKLREIYSPYLKDKDFCDITVHCGSGVTACHTILALDYAGFKIPYLYIGSWSEWSRSNNTIETGAGRL